jgi:P pilus assembly chaperone PapD
MKKIKALIFALGILISTNLSAVSLTPSTFGEVIDYEDGGYKEYKIKNDLQERMRYKVNFTGNEDKFDIQVYPKVILLEPYEEKVVKVLVKKKVDVPDGEYKFTTIISPIKVPVLKEKDISLGEIDIDANLGVNLGVEMYGYVGNLGNPKEDIKFSNIKYDKNKKELVFEIENSMKRSFKLTAVIYETRTKYEVKADIIRIASKNKKEVKVMLDKLEDVKNINFYNAETNESIKEIKL